MYWFFTDYLVMHRDPLDYGSVESHCSLKRAVSFALQVNIQQEDLAVAKLDELDHKIIAALQANGRLSNIDVAEKVGLSHSSCSRRISRLEKDGVIVGYRALTNRHKIGLTIRAYCGVIRNENIKWDVLAETLSGIDGVVSVLAVSGDVDLILEIVARDMQHYSQVVLRDISNTEGVNGTRSSFVLEEIKSIY